MSCKKNPKWLDLVLFWTIIPPMIVAVMVWEITMGFRGKPLDACGDDARNGDDAPHART